MKVGIFDIFALTDRRRDGGSFRSLAQEELPLMGVKSHYKPKKKEEQYEMHMSQ